MRILFYHKVYLKLYCDATSVMKFRYGPRVSLYTIHRDRLSGGFNCGVDCLEIALKYKMIN